MRHKSYIGLCDIPDADFARAILAAFDACGGSATGRRVMLGVMTSHKRLHGLPTKWSVIYPPPEEIASIFVRHPLAMNTVHYADYDGIDEEDSIEMATRFGGPLMDAIQLDMVWPDPAVLHRYRLRWPQVEVVLQVGTRALAEVGNDPRLFADEMRRYGNSLDYVLLDKSGGNGRGLVAEELLPFVLATQRELSELGIAVAGGLGPDTLDLIDPILAVRPSVSVDAQGRLRASGNSLEPMEWDRARRFVEGFVRKARLR